MFCVSLKIVVKQENGLNSKSRTRIEQDATTSTLQNRMNVNIDDFPYLHNASCPFAKRDYKRRLLKVSSDHRSVACATALKLW